jgi:hypothetical protein
MSNATTMDALADAAILSLRSALDSLHRGAPSLHDIPLAVLVDPGLHDPLATEEHAHRLPRQGLNIKGIAPERQPYLLLIDDATRHERALNASVRIAIDERSGRHDSKHGRPLSVCAWLLPRSDGSPDWKALANALERRSMVLPPPPEPPRPLVLRFWDPRVTAHLPMALGAATWQDFLSALGVSRWWTLSSDSALVSVGDAPLDAQSEAKARWELDAAQWRALRIVGLSNRISQAATVWDLEHVPQPYVLRSIASRALAHGLLERDDLLHFAHLALTVHPQFDRHPQAARLLLSPGFAAGARQWSEAFLDELRRGHWLATVQPTPSERDVT